MQTIGLRLVTPLCVSRYRECRLRLQGEGSTSTGLVRGIVWLDQLSFRAPESTSPAVFVDR